jgi:hypothetical protein
MKRFYVVLAVFALVAFMPAGRAAADRGLRADPFEFVGGAGECGTGYPAGSNIVTAAWLDGMGLPDNGGANASTTDRRDNPNKKDSHSGLLLSKNGPTPDCSSSGAEIKGVKGIKVTADFTLGFDYRNGGHCGAGAPRFNVTTKDGQFSFQGGCANGVPSPAPQDPLEWTRVRINTTLAGQGFPPTAIGQEIESISILYDEGTDTPSVSDPMGVGLAVIDNIFINGRVITDGDNNQKQKKDKKDKHDNNGHHGGDDDQGDDD